MQISLSPVLKRFVDDQLASGAYATPEDVLQAAVALLRQSEKFGDFAPRELDALLAEGERGLQDDGASDGDEVFDEVRRRSARRREVRP
jgi:putative addiction module CopG family antidote